MIAPESLCLSSAKMCVCGVYNRRFEGAMASLAVCSRVYACGEWWLMLSLERGVAVNSAVDGKIGKVGVVQSPCARQLGVRA